MKIAIVTGASSGLGREFAKQIPRFYKQLDELWIIARTEEKLVELKKELEEKYQLVVKVLVIDVTDENALLRLKDYLECEKPDVRMLVNAAGMGKIGNVKDVNVKMHSDTIEINCKALTNITSICLSYVSRGSRIINVASASAFSPQPGFAVYAATKAYVYSFSRALGTELSEEGVVVTAVCPGPVDTAFFDIAGEIKESKKALLARPYDVVKQALIDSRMKKSVSIYGLSMKGTRIASSILPDKWLMDIMKRINE